MKTELLEKLCLAFAPSGCEDEARNIILDYIKPFCDDVSVYRDGSVIARLGSRGKKLMVSAHMDEVGFMISDIDERGYLYFSPVGGIDTSVLGAKRVVIGEKRVRGIIGVAPVHLVSKDKRSKKPEADSLYIDIGARDRADAEKYVEIGDFGTFESDFVLFGDSLVKCKALDDRLGCAIMCETIEKLSKTELPDTLYFAFTCREEIGLSGARTAANRIQPDYALVLESTAVGDIADAPEEKRVARLGFGGVLSFADRGTVYDRGFIDALTGIACENGIKYQIKQYVSGGNDASHIHKTAAGAKTAALSAPSRYIHSSGDVADMRDIESMSELLYMLCRKGIN